MIRKEEILEIADETGLTPHVVEKDYVLGWLLAAIYANSVLKKVWVFKGGTCLKKCFFETYRFSEDLDFTLSDESHLDKQFLVYQFTEVSEWLNDNSGIVTPVDRFVFDVYENPRGKTSCEGRIYYQSYFSSSNRSLPKIKLDLTADEILVLPPSDQKVFHNYSDSSENNFMIKSYPYEEVFGEKVRALGERGRPRDLYDVINLYRNDYLPAPEIVRDILVQKCAFKGIKSPTIEDMDTYREDLTRNWEPMLKHQLPALPTLETFLETLPEFFEWLEGKLHTAAPVLRAVTSSGQIYRPNYGHLQLKSTSGASLEVIRFAAGNRLCIDLDYTDGKGDRKVRRIEPYSLRRAQTGSILLYAVRVEDGQIRSYKIDRIKTASVTNQVFTPRYQIELSPTLELTVRSRGVGSSSSLGLPSSASRIAHPTRSVRSNLYRDGPRYVIRCPICDKTFRRKNKDTHLNSHKNKNGGPCSGTTGYYENTVY